jgi:membrane protein YdbS with pleckstrin-like domain
VTSWLALVGVILLWAVLISVAQFRRAGWRVDQEFLMIRSGVLRQTVEFVPRSTIQWCEQSSNWFMRRMRIANVTVATAVRRHQVPELDFPEAEGLLATLSQSGIEPGAIIST